MEQKTKLSLLIILLVVFIAGSAYWVLNKKQAAPIIQTTQTNQAVPEQNPELGQKLPDPADAYAKSDSIREIRGKILSINEKAVYIELEADKNFVVGINPKTPVILQDASKPGSLADLKLGQNVTARVDNTRNAIQIMINK